MANTALEQLDIYDVFRTNSGMKTCNNAVINDYQVVTSYGDKKLIECMMNVVKRTLAD